MVSYRKKRSVRRRPMRRRRTTRRRTSYGPAAISRITSTKVSPLGPMFKATLSYFEPQIDMDPSLSGISWYNFSANGLYDPNITGSGHSPLGFDQLMSMYDHYTVIGAKIIVNLFNTDTTYPMIVGIRVADTTTATNDITQIIENGNVNYTVTNPYKTDGSAVTLTRKLSIKNFFKKPLSDDVFSGAVTSNPAEQVYFQVFCYSTNASFDAAGVRMNVRLEYISLFKEPKLLATS